MKSIQYATYLLIFLHFVRLTVKRVSIKKREPWKPFDIDPSKYLVKLVLYYKTPTSGGRFALVQYFHSSNDIADAWRLIKKNYNALRNGTMILMANEKLEENNVCVNADHPHIFSLRHALSSAFPDAPIESVRLKS